MTKKERCGLPLLGYGHCGRPIGHGKPCRSEQSWDRALSRSSAKARARIKRAAEIDARRQERLAAAVAELLDAVNELSGENLWSRRGNPEP